MSSCQTKTTSNAIEEMIAYYKSAVMEHIIQPIKDEVADGGSQQHVVGTTVRANSLNKLVLLHNVVADVWSSNRQGSNLFKELVERRRKDSRLCYAYNEPAYLISHYLNSDDVMKVLGCNRRTALDYLQALRDIVRCYKRF